MEERNERVYDLIVTTIMAAGIALNIYLALDMATDGQLTKDVSAWLSKKRAMVREYREVARDKARVIAHAQWATYEAVLDESDDDGT